MEKDNTYVPEESGVFPSEVPLDALPKTRWQRSWPVIACGAGLFSDGYLQSVCSTQCPLFRKVNLTSTPGHWCREHYPGRHLWR